MTDRKDDAEERRWDRGWSEHEREQMRRIARLPLWERIRWLEEAQQVIESLRRSREGQGRKDGNDS